ncbi:MAG: hypothetical protein DHS20C16_03450 [Phycisphaerae bacterium]|nr:MAG: hypothetical protein DHS20C16_03450 [Phycisphaerae bacterium]
MISELLFKPQMQAVDPLERRSGWAGIFGTGGRTSSGQNVTPQRSMQSAAVYTCVTFLSKIMASMPIEVAQRSDRGTNVVTDNPIANLLTHKPNPEMTIYDFVSVGMGHLALNGNFYAELVRDARGQVTELWPVHPTQMTLKHIDGQLVYFVRTQHEQVPVLQSDMVHVKWFTNDGITGISPIQHAAEVVGHGLGLQEYGATLLANDATPPLLIEVPVGLDDSSMDNARELLKSFSNRGTGDKRHRAGMLPKGAKLHQLSITNEQAQFLESRQYTDRLIAAIFGVPSVYLNDAVKDTFASSNQKEQDLRKYTLGPLAHNWSLELTTKLFPDSTLFTRFNFSSLLRADPETRAKIRQTDIASGVISPNEAREDEGRNPVDGLDIYQNTKQAETITPGASEQDVPVSATTEPDPAPTFNIHATYAPLLRDALGRVVTKEIRQVKAALKKNAGSPDGFKSWLDTFYEDKKTQQDVTQALSALVASSTEQGIDLIPANFATQYVGSSKGQLAAVMRKAQPQTAWDDLHTCLAAWEDKRADTLVDELLANMPTTNTTEDNTVVNVTVNMPDQAFSIEAAKTPDVTVNVPEQTAPTINVLPADARVDNNVTVQPVITVQGDLEVND